MRDKDDELPFGEVIRRLREDRGMSKSQLARSAELTLGALWKYEHGRVEPGRGVVRRLAAGLGMEPLDLERALHAAREGAAA